MACVKSAAAATPLDLHGNVLSFSYIFISCNFLISYPFHYFLIYDGLGAETIPCFYCLLFFYLLFVVHIMYHYVGKGIE